MSLNLEQTFGVNFWSNVKNVKNHEKIILYQIRSDYYFRTLNPINNNNIL